MLFSHIETDSQNTTAASTDIKQEIEDESTEYLFANMGDIGIDNNHQLIQVAEAGENGQLVLMIGEQTPDGQQVGESSGKGQENQHGQHVSPTKRGSSRKRKNTVTTIDPNITPSRPKRIVVPNIKSEFVYDSITSTTSAPIAPQSSTTNTYASDNDDDSGGRDGGEQRDPSAEDEDDESTHGYTLVQDGNVITAWQTVPEVGASHENGSGKNLFNNRFPNTFFNYFRFRSKQSQ